ncbi:hypothetical protein JTE90_017175 [Oedothorax gibbosus]|uniref:Uncharacterized protein n=1 Tax=Oedothorax gibbosus TaxID=931172 RepID=A0AAV6V9J5_9ARAC|nr:hypothetical protein JTE90_017175 [Oedothorax gibbosus]
MGLKRKTVPFYADSVEPARQTVYLRVGLARGPVRRLLSMREARARRNGRKIVTHTEYYHKFAFLEVWKTSRSVLLYVQEDQENNLDESGRPVWQVQTSSRTPDAL